VAKEWLSLSSNKFLVVQLNRLLVRTSIAAAVLMFPISGTAAAGPTSSVLFSFADPAIAESSGLAASSVGSDVFTINDSGNSAVVFRVDATGATAAIYTLKGATNVDWEDLATGVDSQGRRVLYIADIGDNSLKRKDIAVYRIGEPSGQSADVPWVRYRFSYPDGSHDAEALLVDPATQRIYIATKTLLGNGELFEAPALLSGSAVNRLSPVRSVPAMTTSGDFSPDGKQIVLLTYLQAYWADGVTRNLNAFAVPLQKQNESIAYTADGSSLLVGSEGVHSTVYRVTLPATQTQAPAQTQTPTQAPSPAQSSPAPVAPNSNQSASSQSRILGFVVFIAVIAVSVGGARLARRSRRKRLGWPPTDGKPLP
jgi:hypothetical protein